MEDLKITKEKVLEAAELNPSAKEALESLFPEVFEDDRYIKINDSNLKDFVFIGMGLAPSRELEYKCLVLSIHYNWEFREQAGYHILIPTKK